LQDASLNIQEAVQESSTTEELLSKVNKAIELTPSNNIIVINHATNAEKEYRKSLKLKNQFTTGIPVLDKYTGGFGVGLVSSIVAWTSHGKSMTWNNAIYHNLCKGINCAEVALEIPAETVFLQFLSRHSYAMGNPIPYETIIKRIAPQKDIDFLFNEALPSFENLPGKLRILDRSSFPDWERPTIFRVMRKTEESMGGLVYVVFDHVNIFKYLNPKVDGNWYIQRMTELATDYRTRNGSMIGVGFAVQANREGWKYAKRNEGRYEMTAVSEFNEIERSSTYVTFIYADEIMRNQGEMQVHLQKHRLGTVMEDPEAVQTYCPCSVVGAEFAKSSVNVGAITDKLFDMNAADDDDDYTV